MCSIFCWSISLLSATVRQCISVFFLLLCIGYTCACCCVVVSCISFVVLPCDSNASVGAILSLVCHLTTVPLCSILFYFTRLSLSQLTASLDEPQDWSWNVSSMVFVFLCVFFPLTICNLFLLYGVCYL